MTKDEMQIGFAMALAMNLEAMQKFATLSDEHKQAIIEGTYAVKTGDEMHRYVDYLVNDKAVYIITSGEIIVSNP